jgi:hypothetical protein
LRPRTYVHLLLSYGTLASARCACRPRGVEVAIRRQFNFPPRVDKSARPRLFRAVKWMDNWTGSAVYLLSRERNCLLALIPLRVVAALRLISEESQKNIEQSRESVHLRLRRKRYIRGEDINQYGSLAGKNTRMRITWSELG